MRFKFWPYVGLICLCCACPAIAAETNGLVSWWKLNENAANTTVTDYSGQANTGTASANTSTFTISGKRGAGFNFNGSTYISASATPVNFAETSSFSISAWIKTSSSSTMTMIATWNFLTSSGWSFEMNDTTSGKLQLLIVNSNGSGARSCTSSTSVNDGVFHHVVVTYNGNQDSSGIKFFIDGASDAANSIFNTSPGALANSVLTIGKLSGGVPEYFNGVIDDLRVYNRVLSAAEIRQLYIGNDLISSAGE